MKWLTLIYFTVSACAYQPACTTDCNVGDVSPLIGSSDDRPIKATP